MLIELEIVEVVIYILENYDDDDVCFCVISVIVFVIEKIESLERLNKIFIKFKKLINKINNW